MNQNEPEQDHPHVEVGQSPVPSPLMVPQQPKEHTQETAPNDQGAEGDNGSSNGASWTRRHSAINLVFSFIIAASTIFYVCYSCGQLGVMRETLREMRDSIRFTERPWLSRQSTGDPGELKANAPVTFPIAIHNSGHSPALNVTYRLLGHVALSPLPERIDFSNPLAVISTEAIIAGSGDLSMTGNIVSLPADIVDKINKGQYQLEVGARVDYCDAFGNAYWLEFCDTYSPIAKGHWILCPTENRTGEGGKCKKPESGSIK